MNNLTPIHQCTQFVQNLQEEFNKVSAKNMTDLTFEKESRFALQLLQNNDYLLKIAISNPQSLKNAIINIASIGLTLNPVEKSAYLIPRKGSICLDISYQGLMKIAYNSGSVTFIQPKIVYKNDTYRNTGVITAPLHEYDPFDDRGEIKGVYCVVKLFNGDYMTDEMSLAEVTNIQNRSESWKRNKSGAWASDYSSMVRKTIIKRFYKFWPKTEKTIQLENALAALNEHEGIDFEAEKIEVQEKENAEVKEAVKKQKEDAHKLNQDKKDIIDEIARIAGEACTGKTLEEKGEYMRKTMKINTFKDLDSKNLHELNVVLNAVDWEGN